MNPIPMATPMTSAAMTIATSSIKHDIRPWPLVITTMTGLQDLAATRDFLTTWSHWLARQQPFATLRIIGDSNALLRAKGSGLILKTWLEGRSDSIRRHMVGMATVVPVDQYEKMRNMNVEKLFGVPAATFSDIATALDWLQRQVFGPRNLPFDRTLAMHTIAAMD